MYEEETRASAATPEHHAATSPARGGQHAQPAAGSSPSEADPQRAELFRGARRGVGADGKPAARTAAEIKAAYGRSGCAAGSAGPAL